MKSITSYTPPAYPCPSPRVTFSEPLGQAGTPTTAGVLDEDVEETGAGGVVAWAGLEVAPSPTCLANWTNSTTRR